MSPLPNYPLREEIASSITHGVGAVPAVAGLAVLVAGGSGLAAVAN